MTMTNQYNALAAFMQASHAKTSPASDADIDQLQTSLGFDLTPKYRGYLKRFGVIVAGSSEVYGLGVPDDYYLNVRQAYADLSRDAAYPLASVPLLDDGDGRFYLYDNSSDSVLLWAAPNGGIVQRLNEPLPSFLLSYLQAL
jgi:hypothetical protein